MKVLELVFGLVYFTISSFIRILDYIHSLSSQANSLIDFGLVLNTVWYMYGSNKTRSQLNMINTIIVIY